ncbi:Hypothetical protein, putative [Bodo saltans]|uniref:Uncharacterized protein n=1 Tax=Bodo saltans TaxID=75058 RepID=A0A0S4J7U3_BODSA|nr:Hypothetical protein, putative [Bodo saltans]|eukprot:CUG86056.1 Hypothetical protein, putative [Bodo saltans]
MALGLDSALLVALTASAAIWAKRGEVVEDKLISIVELVTGDPELAARVATDVSKSMGTPSMLLKGVDASSRGQPRLPHSSPRWTQAPRGASSLAKGRHAVRRGGTPELIAILEWFQGTNQWETASIFFQQASRHLQLSTSPAALPSSNSSSATATASSSPYADLAASPSKIATHHNYAYKMHNNEYRAAVNVLFQIFADSNKGHQMMMLIANTCLLPADEEDVLVLLRNVPYGDTAALTMLFHVLSLPRYRHHLDHDPVRSLLLTAACAELPEGIPTSWDIAWNLFERINDETPFGQPYAIRNVFYLMYTAACQSNKRDAALELLTEADRRERESVVEILLHNCRHRPLGVELATRFVGGGSHPANTMNGAVSTNNSASWRVGLSLFHREVSVRNANSLLELLPHAGRQLADLSRGILDEVNTRVLSRETEAVATDELTMLFSTVAKKACWDSALRLAVMPNIAGTTNAQRRAQLRALSPLAIPLVRHRHWAGALHVLTMSLTHGRGRAYRPPSPYELTTCAFAAFKLEKSATGVFWYDRAHAADRNAVLDSNLQREAVYAAARSSWTSALSMIHPSSGGHSLERNTAEQTAQTLDPATVYTLLKSADRDGAVGLAMEALWSLGVKHWKP